MNMPTSTPLNETASSSPSSLDPAEEEALLCGAIDDLFLEPSTDNQLAAAMENMTIRPPTPDLSWPTPTRPETEQLRGEFLIIRAHNGEYPTGPLHPRSASVKIFIDRLLNQRVVNVTAPAGAGKTTLAQAVALELSERGYTVVYVDEPKNDRVAFATIWGLVTRRRGLTQQAEQNQVALQELSERCKKTVILIDDAHKRFGSNGTINKMEPFEQHKDFPINVAFFADHPNFEHRFWALKESQNVREVGLHPEFTLIPDITVICNPLLRHVGAYLSASERYELLSAVFRQHISVENLKILDSFVGYLAGGHATAVQSILQYLHRAHFSSAPVDPLEEWDEEVSLEFILNNLTDDTTLFHGLFRTPIQRTFPPIQSLPINVRDLLRTVLMRGWAEVNLLPSPEQKIALRTCLEHGYLHLESLGRNHGTAVFIPTPLHARYLQYGFASYMPLNSIPTSDLRNVVTAGLQALKREELVVHRSGGTTSLHMGIQPCCRMYRDIFVEALTLAWGPCDAIQRAWGNEVETFEDWQAAPDIYIAHAKFAIEVVWAARCADDAWRRFQPGGRYERFLKWNEVCEWMVLGFWEEGGALPEAESVGDPNRFLHVVFAPQFGSYTLYDGSLRPLCVPTEIPWI
ncbi:hypothetical protein EJ06DRAFT_257719 [Trichodelitschia bisporula]|uniref:AAA+ ATPase domain-containing protein n=1 Tax=Trichodelitschia bisporula TaxID=703511 RepID=A0A6G1HIR4_9PEZI|nr:hypothetical protein EJ06DRAFT_257719 [Trichodelitschia bisporula]